MWGLLIKSVWDSYCRRLGAVKLFRYPGPAMSVIWCLPILDSSPASAFSTPSLHNSLVVSLFGQLLISFWQLLNCWIVASSATTWLAALQLFSQLGWLTTQLSQPPIVFCLYCCCPLHLMISECAIKSGRKGPPERRLVSSQGMQHREVSLNYTTAEYEQPAYLTLELCLDQPQYSSSAKENLC